MTLSEFYLNEWGGNFNGDADALNLCISRAVDVIDNAIYLTGLTVETMPEKIIPPVYKAVCAQVDYIEYNGGVAAMNDNGDMSNVSLGKFSYSEGTQGNSSAKSSYELCEQAASYLRPIGLLYRGVKAI